MSIWSTIFGSRPGEPEHVEITPSGLLMDADGWYYEESLDSDCPRRTIRIQQDRPGDWYVRNTNCRVEELNSPARADEVLNFFIGSFRWLRFEREENNGRGPNDIKIIGTYLNQEGLERESHLGYVGEDVSKALAEEEVQRLWGRIRCLRPPGGRRRPTFCLRFDLLVELEEGVFEDDLKIEARPEDFFPVQQ